MSSSPISRFLGTACAVFLVLAVVALIKALLKGGFKALLDKVEGATPPEAMSTEVREYLQKLSSDLKDTSYKALVDEALKGKLYAINGLASAFLKGTCVKKDQAAAVRLYREAERMGSRSASKALVKMGTDEQAI